MGSWHCCATSPEQQQLLPRRRLLFLPCPEAPSNVSLDHSMTYWRETHRSTTRCPEHASMGRHRRAAPTPSSKQTATLLLVAGSQCVQTSTIACSICLTCNSLDWVVTDL